MADGSEKANPADTLLDDVDADWYRATYPDVDALGLDAETHWHHYGRAMGRAPRPGGPHAQPAISVPRRLSAPAIGHRRRRRAGVATTPDRIGALEQAVNSLAGQVDEVCVYLNGHTTVPAFLRGLSNVRVFSSAEADDLGDAGKFFDLRNGGGGYFLSFDDDIYYPPDYADWLIASTDRHGCPSGVHGTILRGGESGYYSRSGRSLLHFKDRLARDTPVDILGTGTMCIDLDRTPLRVGFDYRNMADLWVARAFRRDGVPLISVARDLHWLRPIETLGGSIWDGNKCRRTVQSILVEQMAAQIAQTPRPKVVGLPRVFIGVKTYNRKSYVQACISSIMATLEDGFDIVLAIADDGSTDGTLESLAELRLPIDLRVIRNNRRYAAGQFNDLVRMGLAQGADFMILLDDDVVFRKPGWISGYHAAAMTSGYHHLCHYNLPHHGQLAPRGGAPLAPPEASAVAWPLSAYIPVDSCMGALMTMTPEMIDAVGFADETNFFVRGLWHVDFSARACRAGFNEARRFFDLRGSNDFIVLQNTLTSDYQTSIPWESEEFKRASAPEERVRRRAIVGLRNRIHSPACPPFIAHPVLGDADLMVNDVFDRVVVLNLDRRPDRMAMIAARLDRMGINFTRYPAIDSQAPDIAQAYAAYADSIRAFPPSRIPDSLSYHQDGWPQAEQARYLQARSGRPAIRSAGAWAYLCGYREILTQALEDGCRTILVLDDDCLFHRDFSAIFARAVEELPARWRTLHLGTMQFNPKRTEPYSDHLYLPHGYIVGSHAVGYAAAAFPAILNRIEMMTLPFDVGPLQQDAMHHRDLTFVIRPNIAIQDDLGSDINSSEHGGAGMTSAAERYGWSMEDYVL